MVLRFLADLPSIIYNCSSKEQLAFLPDIHIKHLAPEKTLQAVHVTFEVAFLCLVTYFHFLIVR